MIGAHVIEVEHVGVGLLVDDVFKELRETRAGADVLGGIVDGHRCPLYRIVFRSQYLRLHELFDRRVQRLSREAIRQT